MPEIHVGRENSAPITIHQEASMPTQVPTPSQSPTALGQLRWFVGMLAEVKASAADTNGQYTLVEITAPAGLESPLHVHYTEDEGYHVLEGDVTLVVGEETVELASGQHGFGPRNIPHKLIVGPNGARMLLVFTPGGYENLLEAASVPAEAPTVPPPSVVPPDDIAESVRRHGNELLPG